MTPSGTPSIYRTLADRDGKKTNVESALASLALRVERTGRALERLGVARAASEILAIGRELRELARSCRRGASEASSPGDLGPRPLDDES